MAKISLTIDKNYCADWKLFHGIRELLQNAKDADDSGWPMTVTHYPRTNRLEIVNKGVYVEPSNLLILGKSGKRPGEQRGQFGEGFVLGCLALIRNGFDVKFVNGNYSWRTTFEEPDEGHPLAGNAMLTFKSHKISQWEPDFTVEVENLPAEVWEVLRKFFLFIAEPDKEQIISTDEGTLLMEPSRLGQVFCRGIFVRQFEDLSCGYDLNHLTLDRDRRFIDEWDLHWKLGLMWKEACNAHPDKIRNQLYQMAKKGTVETKKLGYHADEKLLKAMRSQFEDEHGADSMPVISMTEAEEINAIGGKSVVVNDVLKDLLNRAGLSSDVKKKALEGAVEQRFSPQDLTEQEMQVVRRLSAIVKDLVVVKFRGGTAECRVLEGEPVIGVSRDALSKPLNAVVKSLVITEAKKRAMDPLDMLVAHVASDPPVE